MDANEFWCRAFLAAMGEHVRDLERCEEVANAALWRAQRRGMVTGERAANAPDAEPEPDVVRWLAAQEDPTSCGPRFGVWRPTALAHQERRFHARRVEYAAGDLHLFGDEGGPEVSLPVRHIMRRWAKVDAPPKTAAQPQPELERVEVKATPDELKPGWWRVCVPNVGVFVMLPGDERVARPDGAAIRIKWGETCPPKPIEVWLERR